MFIKLCWLFILFASIHCQSLQSVSDDELLQYIKEEEKLIVLFCKYLPTEDFY